MKIKTIRVAVLALAIVCTVALVIARRQTVQTARIQKPNQAPPAETPAIVSQRPPLNSPATEPTTTNTTTSQDSAARASSEKTGGGAPATKMATALSPPVQTPGRNNPGPTDPLARIALSLVGADPAAEEYWVGAINDVGLSSDERQNLIEDLNEDGLSNPKHPGPDDLPLIANRIRLIEELAPFAMDQVNFDAFQEAYKDLVNLANLAMGGGEPVR